MALFSFGLQIQPTITHLNKIPTILFFNKCGELINLLDSILNLLFKVNLVGFKLENLVVKKVQHFKVFNMVYSHDETMLTIEAALYYAHNVLCERVISTICNKILNNSFFLWILQCGYNLYVQNRGIDYRLLNCCNFFSLQADNCRILIPSRLYNL